MIKRLLAFLPFLGLVALLNAATINGSFVFEGLTRTYSFYVPASYTPGQAVPLMLNLHGYTSNGAQQAAYTNFMAIADTAGFIVVHPDGTIDPNTSQRFWNFGIFGTSVNDIGFLQALIDTLSANYTINPNRVYCTGMSNGGYMSYALACQTTRFAAIASVTGSMSVPMYNSCNPSSPIPVMEIHGTADPTVPYAGNTTSKPIADVVAFWVTKNNCNPTANVTTLPDADPNDGTTAEHQVYTGGTNGHTVEHYKINNGGHTWPGGTVNLPAGGNTCRDFSASKEIWRFFSQYQKGTTSSIAEQPAINLNLWPNPTADILYIQADQLITSVTVTDIQGRVVQECSGENIKKINLGKLKMGSYVLEVNSSGMKVARIIVIGQ